MFTEEEKKERRKLTLKKYYETNKADIRKRQIVYQERTKDKYNERQKKYYHSHKQEVDKRVKKTEFEKRLSRAIAIRKYYEKNKENIALKKKEWRFSKPGLYRLYCAKRRFLKKSSSNLRLTSSDIDRIFARQRGECFWCSCKLYDFHIDHVIPLAKGGRHSVGNIVISCPKCNKSKSDKLPIEFKILNNIKF